MRTKNVLKTFLYGVLFTGIIAILGLVKTKVLLDKLGEEYVGAYQLFTQLFTYISLVEGGIGASVAYHLYKPIHEKDEDKINAVYLGARKYFMIVGAIIIVLGFILSFGIMFLIRETTIESWYIRICFILFTISSSFNYFTSAHALLYESEQKLYKSSNLNHILSICESISAIVIAMFGGKLLTILIVYLAMSLLKNITLIFNSRRDHPSIMRISAETVPDSSFKKEANNLIVAKVGTLVNENIDVVILSSFIGLKPVVVYTAYNQIVNMIVLIVQRLNSALLPSVGNLLVAEKEKARETFYELNALVFFIGNIISVPLIYVLSGFIGLWYGEEYVVPAWTCLLFVAILYIGIVKIPLESYIKAAGEFKSVRNCTIVQSIVNATLSIALVWQLGVGGVLIATVFSFIVGTFTNFPRIISRKIICEKTSEYYKKAVKFLVGLAIGMGVCYFVNKWLSSSNLLQWAVNGFILFATNFVITVIYYSLTGETAFLKRLRTFKRLFRSAASSKK